MGLQDGLFFFLRGGCNALKWLPQAVKFHGSIFNTFGAHQRVGLAFTYFIKNQAIGMPWDSPCDLLEF